MTLPSVAVPSIGLPIANLFTFDHLIYHQNRHKAKAPTVVPHHSHGALSDAQYKSLTETFAMVCNPDSSAGHVMAFALHDDNGRKPHTKVAINQVFSGQHDDVLERCKEMLKSVYLELSSVNKETPFATRDSILRYFVEFGKARLHHHIGITPPEDSPNTSQSTLASPAMKPPAFLPAQLAIFSELVDNELSYPTRLTLNSPEKSQAFQAVQSGLCRLKKTTLFCLGKEHIRQPPAPGTTASTDDIVEFLLAVEDLLTGHEDNLWLIFDDVCMLQKAQGKRHKNGLERGTFQSRLTALHRYVRGATFMVNLTMSNSLETQQPLSSWFGSIDVSKVTFSVEAFGDPLPPTNYGFPGCLPAKTLQRWNVYRASRSPRSKCTHPTTLPRTRSPPSSSSASSTPSPSGVKKKTPKINCPFCGEGVDKVEALKFNEAYDGASGRDAERGFPPVHAEILLAYDVFNDANAANTADTKNMDSNPPSDSTIPSWNDSPSRTPGGAQNAVYICSFKKACFCCEEFFRCCDSTVVYTLQSHGKLYYKWRLLNQDYVQRHIPRMANYKRQFVGKINSIIHNSIPSRLPPDCFSCCKTRPGETQDIDLKEDPELGPDAFSTRHWPLPAKPTPMSAKMTKTEAKMERNVSDQQLSIVSQASQALQLDTVLFPNNVQPSHARDSSKRRRRKRRPGRHTHIN